MTHITSKPIWVICGATLAGLAVICGAFGSHGLKGMVSSIDLAIWEKAVFYHLIHAIALVGLGFKATHYRQLMPVCIFITFGVLIFSGSLYLLVLTQFRWLGAITPLGGISLIVGWIWLAVVASCLGDSRANPTDN